MVFVCHDAGAGARCSRFDVILHPMLLFRMMEAESLCLGTAAGEAHAWPVFSYGCLLLSFRVLEETLLLLSSLIFYTY